jgi:hypothetical protein
MAESPAKPRTEVSIAGRLTSMCIIGSTVTFIIFLENFRVAAWLPYALHILAGGIALGVLIPMLFFRRPVED